MKTFLLLVFAVVTVSMQAQKLIEGEKITFSHLGESGLLSKELLNQSPHNGCLMSYDLEFPEFENAVMNKASVGGWVSGYLTRGTQFTSFKKFENLSRDAIENKYFKNAFELGYYLLLKLSNEKYLAVLPLVSDKTMAYISVYEGKPRININTYGTSVYSGDAPLFSWAFADDPYTATQKCWDLALSSDFCKENVQARSKKAYPELYEYLGWCTWEAYEGSINEEIVKNAIQEIKKDDIPIRWVIVDDGYLDQKKSETSDKTQLLSFGLNSKFPNGWSPITSLKDEASVKWIGIWRNMSGGMTGVSPDHTMKELNNYLFPRKVYRQTAPDREIFSDSAMLIKPDMESSMKFYDHMATNSLQGGFDFMKVDFQTYNFWMYSGTENAVNSTHQNNQALEKTCYDNNMPLLNCISQSNINVFNTKYSVISRASVDIKLDNNNMGRTTQSFMNNMWWGDILIGDFDMYHTGNDKTAQYLTIARAVSGGPVYISDEPGHFNAEIIEPLIFSDGKIIRALAPAVPLNESLFLDANTENQCYRSIAPMRHKSCAIAVFNFSKQETAESFVSINDYPFAAAKEQPYKGLWAMPEEGLVVYDWEVKQGNVLTNNYTFKVERMKGKIFNLSPIIKGWAVIGRSDKYMGGCTYHIVKQTKSELEVILDESGPFVVYNANKKPTSNKGAVDDLENGFYKVNIPVGERNSSLKLQLK